MNLNNINATILIETVLAATTIVLIVVAVFYVVFANVKEDENISNSIDNNGFLLFMKLYITILSSIMVIAQFLSIIDRGNKEVMVMDFADKYLYYISKVIHFLFKGILS